MREDEIRALRSSAEKAVADMPPGELKTKAFEVILGHLLGQTKDAAVVPSTKRAPAHPQKAAGRTANTCTARILVLKEEGFFSEQRTMKDVKEELAKHGWHYALGALAGKLQQLVQKRALRRLKTKVDKRDVWNYSEP